MATKKGADASAPREFSGAGLSHGPKIDSGNFSVTAAFRLERDGAAIHLLTHKVESLFAYLALHPEPHAREKLATLFWGDSPNDLARRSLRTALASLRKELGDEVIVADRDIVQLNTASGLWVDANEFQQQVGQYLAADSPNAMSFDSDLYQGELLADFYDDWILAERERLHTLYLDALLRMTQRLREQSEYLHAIEIARRVLAVDIANEQAHQQLMFCHWSLGDPSAALKQFDECQRALHDELGVEPSPDTLALYERIKHAAIAIPSRATANTNLPIPLTSFIGRVQEIAMVKQLLGNTRLLTLTGVGGCGKTRLAIQVARDVLDQFANGAWWVELAAAREDERVLQLVVKAVGLVESQQLSPLDALLNHLRTKQALLVVDNCEHLVKACAELAETILSQCSRVRILTTSREALSISGEIAWLVPSLSLPAKDDLSVPTHLLQSESVRLFVERARAIRPDFALTPAHGQAVVDICRRLDGIPLAIELAAARLKALTVEQIDARLDDRFGLLTTGSRTALPRQQTLRATIDWSVDLLTPLECKLFSQLSVFAGGFTADAAQAITDQPNAFDLLTNLVDKSLAIADVHGEAARYGMLETIRQYADEKLRAKDNHEEHALRQRHLNFYLALAQEAELKLDTVEQTRWLTQLDAELDNFRVAIDWAFANDVTASGLKLVTALLPFWDRRDYFGERREQSMKALARTDSSERTSERAKLLNVVGYMQSFYFRNHDQARTMFEEALSISMELGDQVNIADSLSYQSFETYRQKDFTTTQQFHEKVIVIWRELGNTAMVAETLSRRAQTTRVQGDYQRAQSMFEEAISMFTALNEKINRATTVRRFGRVALQQGDFEKAMALCQQSLKLNLETGHKHGVVSCLATFAGIAIAIAQGQNRRAAKLFGAVEALLRELDRPMLFGDVYDYENDLSALRAQLDEVTLAAAWAEGQAMTLEQAVEEAMRV